MTAGFGEAKFKCALRPRTIPYVWSGPHFAEGVEGCYTSLRVCSEN